MQIRNKRGHLARAGFTLMEVLVVMAIIVVLASVGGVIAKDEAQVLLVIAVLWAIAVAIAAFASRVPLELRRKE